MLVGMAFFVIPVPETQAQSGGAFPYCFNSSTGAVMTQSSNPANPCPAGSTRDSMKPKPKAVCIIKNSATQYTLIAAVNVTTNGECANGATPPVAIPNSVYKLVDNIQQYGGGTNTNVNTNTPTNTRTNTGGGTNTTTPPSVQGTCDKDFHVVGPLCVPNSGFKPDSLVGNATAPGIAIKIIKFMLYFAGIVAVIMAIIGGYQIMTAGGNPTQALNGRKTLTNAIIGLIIVVLSYIIVSAVINFVTK